MSQKTPGYCWPTPKYRNWCVQHAFFEGKKAEQTSTLVAYVGRIFSPTPMSRKTPIFEPSLRVVSVCKYSYINQLQGSSHKVVSQIKVSLLQSWCVYETKRGGTRHGAGTCVLLTLIPPLIAFRGPFSSTTLLTTLSPHRPTSIHIPLVGVKAFARLCTA